MNCISSTFYEKKLLDGNVGWSLHNLFDDISKYTKCEYVIGNEAGYSDWFKKSPLMKDMHTQELFLTNEYQNRKYMTALLLQSYPELAYAYIMDMADMDMGKTEETA